MRKTLPITIALGALLPLGAQAQIIASEDFAQGTGNPALAGYSGASEVGLSGSWTQLGGQGMTIVDGSGSHWGAVQPNWPAAEHTAWQLSQYSIGMSSTINLTTDGSFYLSYLVQSDQSNNGSQVGFINTAGTEELMAGLGYSGASNKGVTAYYGPLGTSIQQNANGTDVAGWSGMNQYQVVCDFSRIAGDLSVTLDYYLGSASGPLESTRTVDLGLVSDTFNQLSLQADGWVDLDSITVGNTLGDVMGVVPEPSTVVPASVGLALALFALKRKNCAR
jgi:hypothetical protein